MPSWPRTLGRFALCVLAVVVAVLTLGVIRPRRPRLDDVSDDLEAAAEQARLAGETAEREHQARLDAIQVEAEIARRRRLADEQAEAELLRTDRAARRRAAEAMLRGDDP